MKARIRGFDWTLVDGSSIPIEQREASEVLGDDDARLIAPKDTPVADGKPGWQSDGSYLTPEGRHLRDDSIRFCADVRAARPDIAISGDFIVGFPGETEDDFHETITAVEEVGFDSAFTFVYSPRAGTEAAAMSDQIPDDLKRDRIERLVEVVQRTAAARNAQRVGRVEQVLVEAPSRTDPALLRGRTRRNTTVNFAGTSAPGETGCLPRISSASAARRNRSIASPFLPSP